MVDSDPRTVLARAKSAMVDVPGPNTSAKSSAVDGTTPVGNTTWYTAPSVLADLASASFAWVHTTPRPPTTWSSGRSPLDTSAEAGAPIASAQFKKGKSHFMTLDSYIVISKGGKITHLPWPARVPRAGQHILARVQRLSWWRQPALSSTLRAARRVRLPAPSSRLAQQNHVHSILDKIKHCKKKFGKTKAKRRTHD